MTVSSPGTPPSRERSGITVTTPPAYAGKTQLNELEIGVDGMDISLRRHLHKVAVGVRQHPGDVEMAVTSG